VELVPSFPTPLLLLNGTFSSWITFRASRPLPFSVLVYSLGRGGYWTRKEGLIVGPGQIVFGHSQLRSLP